jgi:hypothetical protein
LEKRSKVSLRRRIRCELGDYVGIQLQMVKTNQMIRAGDWSLVDRRVRRGLAKFFADSLCVDAQGVERPIYPYASLIQCQRRIERLKKILRRLGDVPGRTSEARPRGADLVVRDG